MHVELRATPVNPTPKSKRHVKFKPNPKPKNRGMWKMGETLYLIAQSPSSSGTVPLLVLSEACLLAWKA
jgi:hypothetical protein